MIDHLGIPVKNHATAKKFYTAALAPLGIGVIMEVSKAESGGDSDATGFGAGAKDNGAPGIRAHYHPDYYGALVIDPNGVNLEAVCHKPA